MKLCGSICILSGDFQTSGLQGQATLLREGPCKGVAILQNSHVSQLSCCWPPAVFLPLSESVRRECRLRLQVGVKMAWAPSLPPRSRPLCVMQAFRRPYVARWSDQIPTRAYWERGFHNLLGSVHASLACSVDAPLEGTLT